RALAQAGDGLGERQDLEALTEGVHLGAEDGLGEEAPVGDGERRADDGVIQEDEQRVSGRRAARGMARVDALQDGEPPGRGWRQGGGYWVERGGGQRGGRRGRVLLP